MKLLIFSLVIALIATVFAFAFYIKTGDDAGIKTKKIAQLIVGIVAVIVLAVWLGYIK